jgi:hypothetical protein
MDSVVLDEDVFAQRAQTILRLIQELRSEIGLQEAIRVAMDRYVHDEANVELVRFGQVLLLARHHAVLQQQLDSDREELHHGHLNHDLRVSVGHHYEMLRREACEYNHLLRGLIEACGPYFLRDDLLDWLTTSSQGRREWARGEVVGAISEIALHAALQGLPELRSLRYATLDEDLSGFDFIAQWQGQMVTFDAKTGFYPPLAEHKHGHRHLEISVPRESVKDFRVTRKGLDLLRHEVRQALQREVEIEVHAPHSYFRALPA